MSNQDKLLGSWEVTVATATQGTFPALLTFTADGSVIAAEPPGQFESSGHGTWADRDDGAVAYTFVALVGDQSGNSAGNSRCLARCNSMPPP